MSLTTQAMGRILPSRICQRPQEGQTAAICEGGDRHSWRNLRHAPFSTPLMSSMHIKTLCLLFE